MVTAVVMQCQPAPPHHWNGVQILSSASDRGIFALSLFNEEYPVGLVREEEKIEPYFGFYAS